MDTAEELRMNLASLQRIDPYIANIKESASQVYSRSLLFKMATEKIIIT